MLIKRGCYCPLLGQPNLFSHFQLQHLIIILHSLVCLTPNTIIGINSLSYNQLESDRFKRHITYAIKEESEIGSFVGDLRTDSDVEQAMPPGHLGTGSGNKSNLSFELYDDSTDGLFRLEMTSGQLFVARRIDRETICPGHEANLPALDATMGHGVLSSNQEISKDDSNYDKNRVPRDINTAVCQLELTVFLPPSFWINVIITVQDINDHEPKFTPPFKSHHGLNTANQADSIYTVRVSEAVEPGYQVPLVGAVDKDVGLNGIQTYSLHGTELASGSFELHFEAPYSLYLLVLTRLDAETKVVYTGELVACDGGLPVPKCGRLAMRLLVTDVNDNKPVFTQSVYSVVVQENASVGSVIGRVLAEDADTGLYGQITYQLGQTGEPGLANQFSVHPDTGEVILKTPLNARVLNKVSIPIIARDAGPIPLVSQAVFRLEIRDVNNHRPWIQVRPIPSYTGESSGQSALSTSDTLALPTMTISAASHNQMSVAELQPAGTNVGLVISGDDDVGRNSEVACRLTEGMMLFKLDHSNEAKGRQIYSLLTAVSLDRETAPDDGRLTVRIRCTDRGLPTPLWTEEEFGVLLIDVDEFEPQFPQELVDPVIVKLEENLLPGSAVIRLSATDKDASARLVYSLSTEAQTYFTVDSSTAQVFTRVQLDRETQPEIGFTLFASDFANNGFKPFSSLSLDRTASIRVQVLLTDVNDNVPSLTGQRVFQIVENRPGYSDLIGQLNAVDLDAGNNGSVQFNLLAVLTGERNRLPITDRLFSLDRLSGRLFVQTSLDREEHSVYHLQVQVQDLGQPISLSSTQEVRIEVLDENDNAPTWQASASIGMHVIYTPRLQKDRELLNEEINNNNWTSKRLAQAMLFAAINRSRLDTTMPVYEYGLANLTHSVPPGHSILKLAANDRDALHNANLTFDIIAIQQLNAQISITHTAKLRTDKHADLEESNSVDNQLQHQKNRNSVEETYVVKLSPSGVRLIDQDEVSGFFSLNRLTGDFQTGSSHLEKDLFEVHLLVTDNGQPVSLSAKARLFVYTNLPSIASKSAILNSGNVYSQQVGSWFWGMTRVETGNRLNEHASPGSETTAAVMFLGSDGQISLPLLIGLVGTTCLISICLLIAIGLIRQRAARRQRTLIKTASSVADNYALPAAGLDLDLSGFSSGSGGDLFQEKLSTITDADNRLRLSNRWQKLRLPVEPRNDFLEARYLGQNELDSLVTEVRRSRLEQENQFYATSITTSSLGGLESKSGFENRVSFATGLPSTDLSEEGFVQRWAELEHEGNQNLQTTYSPMYNLQMTHGLSYMPLSYTNHPVYSMSPCLASVHTGHNQESCPASLLHSPSPTSSHFYGNSINLCTSPSKTGIIGSCSNDSYQQSCNGLQTYGADPNNFSQSMILEEKSIFAFENKQSTPNTYQIEGPVTNLFESDAPSYQLNKPIYAGMHKSPRTQTLY